MSHQRQVQRSKAGVGRKSHVILPRIQARVQAHLSPKPSGPDLRRSTPADVLNLQQTVGNRVVSRMIQAQRDGGDSLTVGAGFERRLAAARGQGAPMPPGLQRRLESNLGADLSGVRVHTDPESAQMAGSIQAKAFTHGADVYMPAANYQPESPAGARLLAHEAAHVVQQGAARPMKGVQTKRKPGTEQPSESSGPQIQRKIGFELETGIPITIRMKGGYYKAPTHAWEEAVVGGSKITVDSSPGHTQDHLGRFGDWPIIEFVSEAVDDTQDPDTFEATAQQWVDKIGELRDLVDGTPPPNKLKDVVGGAAASKRVGFIDAQTKMSDRTVDSISVQFTIGAQMDKIAQVFQGMGTIAQGTGGGKSIWEKADALKAASTNVTNFMPRLEKKVSSPYSSSIFDSKTVAAQNKQRKAQDLAELKGFLELVSGYLVAGKMVSSRGYIKNRIQLFYKSKLSSVAEKMINTNRYAFKILVQKPKYRTWLKTQLININDRDGSEKVFMDTAKPLVDAWLDDVLLRRDDKVLDEAKNPWSEEIKPDKVKNKLAAVMEIRTPGTVFGLNAPLDIKANPDGVVAYLKRLYAANQAWQNLR